MPVLSFTATPKGNVVRVRGGVFKMEESFAEPLLWIYIVVFTVGFVVLELILWWLGRDE